MEAAIQRGPHVSAMEPEAMQQLHTEVQEKVQKGQVRVVTWDSIKGKPPRELKISPIAMIPHKSRKYRAILDLSFECRLANMETIKSVNATSTKTAPKRAIDQMGHSLMRIVYAFAEADRENPEVKIFAAKWDVKDGFWRLVAEKGEEWNFAYVLPQEKGKPIKLVIPTSLQMGWIESPPYFCTASETARDVAQQLIETQVGTTGEHKFHKLTRDSEEYRALPATAQRRGLRYLVEVYVDDFVALAMAVSKAQLDHVAGGVMHGIHDVFPSNEDDNEDAISLKKLRKHEGTWMLRKEILGFEFYGEEKHCGWKRGSVTSSLRF